MPRQLRIAILPAFALACAAVLSTPAGAFTREWVNLGDHPDWCYPQKDEPKCNQVGPSYGMIIAGVLPVDDVDSLNLDKRTQDFSWSFDWAANNERLGAAGMSLIAETDRLTLTYTDADPIYGESITIQGKVVGGLHTDGDADWSEWGVWTFDVVYHGSLHEGVYEDDISLYGDGQYGAHKTRNERKENIEDVEKGDLPPRHAELLGVLDDTSAELIELYVDKLDHGGEVLDSVGPTTLSANLSADSTVCVSNDCASSTLVLWNAGDAFQLSAEDGSVTKDFIEKVLMNPSGAAGEFNDTYFQFDASGDLYNCGTKDVITGEQFNEIQGQFPAHDDCSRYVGIGGVEATVHPVMGMSASMLAAQDRDLRGGFLMTSNNLPRSIPEPGTLALFGLGLLGLSYVARQRAHEG